MLSATRSLKGLVEKWGGSTAFLFVCMHFAHDLCLSVLVPLLPLIRTEFGLSYLQSGLLLSAYNIVSGLSQFVGGSLGSRFSLALVAAIGLGGTGIAILACGLSSTYYLLMVFLVVLGIFSGGYHPTSNSMLSIYFGPKQRGKVVGFHMLGGTAALVVAPVVGGIIADKLDWHFAFVILSLPAIAAAWLIFPALRRRANLKPTDSVESAVSHPATSADISKGMPRLMSTWRVWQPIIAVVALTLLSQVVAQAAIAYIPMYFVDKAQTAAVDAAMLMGVLRAGGIPGGLFGGWLTDRWGGRNAVVLALAATGPVLLLITGLPVGTLLILALVLFGGILIVRQAAVQTFLMDNTPVQIRSTVFGIYFGLSHEGSSILQPVVGHYMDIFGIGTVYTFIALISIALSLAALFLVMPIRRKSPSSSL